MKENKINQVELANLFLEWECEFSVEKWMIGDIHIWPIIKKSISFTLFNDTRGTKKKLKKKFLIERVFKKGKLYLEARLYLRSLNLKKAKFLFCSSFEQRILFREKEFNRFLEPIMDYLEEKEINSYFFEYPFSNKSNANRPDRIIDIRKLLVLYSSSKNRNSYSEELEKLDGFINFTEEVYKETGIDPSFIKKRILKNILAIKSWEGVFTKVIKLTQPKFILGLVYYSNPIYGLNLAANKLGVHSIDLQHGGLGPAHPAYYFSKVPKDGYNLLPRTFWVWNSSSYQDIYKWSKGTPHKVMNGGNPWIGFLNKNNTQRDFKKPVILFTLQPLGDIISSRFLKVIYKTKDDFNWWLRFHPRMSKSERTEILEILRSKDILNYIVYKDSSEAPLPEVLNSCNLHISQTSGSIVEAAMLRRFSLIIHKQGVILYKNLIDDGWAEPCLSEGTDEIIKKIETSLDKKPMKDKQVLTDYRRTLDALVEK